MRPEDIQKFCLEGTEAYLRFLRDNHRGVEETGVLRIARVGMDEPACFKLVLQGLTSTSILYTRIT